MFDKYNKEKAEAAGYMIVTPEAVIATHLNQVLVKHAGDLIGQDEVQELLDNLQKTSPKLVETVVPKILPLNQLLIQKLVEVNLLYGLMFQIVLHHLVVK